MPLARQTQQVYQYKPTAKKKKKYSHWLKITVKLSYFSSYVYFLNRVEFLRQKTISEVELEQDIFLSDFETLCKNCFLAMQNLE